MPTYPPAIEAFSTNQAPALRTFSRPGMSEVGARNDDDPGYLHLQCRSCVTSVEVELTGRLKEDSGWTFLLDVAACAGTRLSFTCSADNWACCAAPAAPEIDLLVDCLSILMPPTGGCLIRPDASIIYLSTAKRCPHDA
jgi:hypothetical protein